MDLNHYIQIFRKKWWIVAIAFAVTTGLTVVLVLGQPRVYESSATFVVRPRSVDAAEIVRATDTLIRGAEINSTYAQIARSQLIQIAPSNASRPHPNRWRECRSAPR